MHREDVALLFAGSSHPELGRQIAGSLDVSLGKVLIETFPDGEIGVQILENVQGRDVFVLQSIALHPNHYLMEMLILVDALKRASARSIIAVVPYFGYARQDRRGEQSVAITAKLVADMLEKAGVTQVLTIDLHAEQVQGFFNIPVDNLYARPLLVEAIRNAGLRKDLVVVAPDVGSIKLAQAYAESLKVDFAVVDKRRVSAKQVEPNALIGAIDGKDILLVDDICSTGGTLKTASLVCKKAGAKSVFAAVTHGLFVGQAFEESAIEKMYVSNTIPLPENRVDVDRLEVVSVASLLGRAIRSIAYTKSISPCFSPVH